MSAVAKPLGRLRPQIERRHVFVGRFVDEQLTSAVRKLDAAQRSDLIAKVAASLADGPVIDARLTDSGVVGAARRHAHRLLGRLRLADAGADPGRGARGPVQPHGTTISLSAYMTSNDGPVLEYSPRSYRVALSNHADFEGTLEYVAATGARFVLTDNTRGKGIELAEAIRSQLGVQARASTGELSPAWGA